MFERFPQERRTIGLREETSVAIGAKQHLYFDLEYGKLTYDPIIIT